MLRTWRDSAACTGIPVEVFFPDEEENGGSKPNYAPAIAICAGCSVRDLCLAEAIAVSVRDDKWGVFGGLTPAERRAVWRKNKKLALQA